MEVGKILCGCVQLYSNLRKHNDYYKTLACAGLQYGYNRFEFDDSVHFDDYNGL